jgi:NAD-dependent dihydropyrimidine dehydrogenase PreA subunit
LAAYLSYTVIKKAVKFIKNLLPEYSKETDVVHNGNNIEIHYDECIECGKCKRICPMKVFDIVNKKPVVINEVDCIHCSLCKEQCPSQAIAIHHTWTEAIAIAKRHIKKISL